MSPGIPARGAAVAALLAVLVAGGLACGEPSEPPAQKLRGRVLLIGIDGAAPRLAFPWAEAGELPNLAALAREGVSGPLLSHQPLLSPRIWTSIATGKGPAKHGIFHWLHEDPGGHLRLLQSFDRKGWALWNIASDAGLRVAVVNWLNSYPPERVEGVMISDFAVPGQRSEKEDLGRMFAAQISQGAQTELPAEPARAGTTLPASWAQRLAELAAAGDELAAAGDPFADLAADLRPSLRDLLARTLRADRLTLQIALEAEAQTHPDLLMVYLPGIDRVSHYLWGAVDPLYPYPERLRLLDAERAAAEAALHAYYRQTDAFIGRLVARFGPGDLVLVLSDHGFEARVMEGQDLTGGHDSARAEHGVLFARGPAIPAGAKAGPVGVNDITPTILCWLGLPVGADMDGAPARFLALGPPARIATWDTRPVERTQAAAPELEQEIIEQLRSFGYVEQ